MYWQSRDISTASTSVKAVEMAGRYQYTHPHYRCTGVRNVSVWPVHWPPFTGICHSCIAEKFIFPVISLPFNNGRGGGLQSPNWRSCLSFIKKLKVTEMSLSVLQCSLRYLKIAQQTTCPCFIAWKTFSVSKKNRSPRKKKSSFASKKSLSALKKFL